MSILWQCVSWSESLTYSHSVSAPTPCVTVIFPLLCSNRGWSKWKWAAGQQPCGLCEGHQHPAPQIPLVQSWMTPAFTSFTRNSFSLDMLWVQDCRDTHTHCICVNTHIWSKIRSQLLYFMVSSEKLKDSGHLSRLLWCTGCRTGSTWFYPSESYIFKVIKSLHRVPLWCLVK